SPLNRVPETLAPNVLVITGSAPFMKLPAEGSATQREGEDNLILVLRLEGAPNGSKSSLQVIETGEQLLRPPVLEHGGSRLGEVQPSFARGTLRGEQLKIANGALVKDVNHVHGAYEQLLVPRSVSIVVSNAIQYVAGLQHALACDLFGIILRQPRFFPH